MSKINSDFFDIAEKKGHKIIYFALPQTKSISVPNGKAGCIGIDPSLSRKETRTCLAHELGHCEYGGFYTINSPLDIMEKHEYRANVWAIRRAVPFLKLKEAIQNGITEPWELSDYFDVTEDMIRFAITYYVERRGFALDVMSNE